MKKENITSVLKLQKVVFDKIEFKRLGISSDKELELEMQTNTSQREDVEVYRVELIIKGKKAEEYTFEISLLGFFTFDTQEELKEEMKHTLLSKNAVAILMPYLRSEVSLLTAQPGVECVVLPVFNINNMMKGKE